MKKLFGYTALLLKFLSINAYLSLYLDHREVKRLLGLSSELYYVQEGVVNDYALNFVVPIPAHVSDLRFAWNSRPGKQVFYHFEVIYPQSQSLDAMEAPFFNISQQGTVPKTPSFFQITLPCTGKSSAEIDVTIQLNVTGYERRKDGLVLNFRRKKFCLKDEVESPVEEKKVLIEPEMRHDENDETADVMTMVAVGTAVVFVTLSLTLVCVVLARKRKLGRGITPSNCRSVSNFYLRTDLIPFDSKPRNSIGSASYASIASLQKEYALTLQKSLTSYGASQTSHYLSNPIPTVVSVARSDAAKTSVRLDYSTAFSPYSLRSEPPRPYAHCYESPAMSSKAESVVSAASQVERPSDPLERIRRLVMPRFCLRDTTVLSEGAFGKLLDGRFKSPSMRKEVRVLVKTVTEHASPAQKTLLLTEGTFLACLQHRHILPPVAVCLEGAKQPVIIYTFPEKGNLKRFLMSSRQRSPEDRSTFDLIQLNTGDVERDDAEKPALHTRDIVEMAIHVTLGMLYLHRHGLVHKDLATRNCVIDERCRVKVADPALSRDLFPDDYHCLGDNENRPIKWMSYEGIDRREYTTAGDVWSFGVLLWEMTTLAQQPYPEIDPFEMAEFLRDGFRLQQPLNCPDELFAVMACCWLESPAQRPTFMQLLACLQDFHTALGKYI